MSGMNREMILPTVFAIAAGVAFGAGGPISQLVAERGFSIPNVTCAQLVCAALTLGIICLVRGYKMPGFRVCLKLAGVGVFNAGATYCYYIAIDMLSVGCAVAFQFQYVWIALVLGCITSRTAPAKRSVACALMVIAGSLMGSGLVDEVLLGTVSVDFLGIGVAMLCALFYALFMHFNSLIELEYPPLLRTFVQVVGAAIVGLVATPFMTAQPLAVALAPYGFIMGFVMTVTPCACLAFASAKLPGSLVAVLSASELPMAVLTGVAVLGETLTPLKGIGTVVICAAIAVSNLRGEAEYEARNEPAH